MYAQAAKVLATRAAVRSVHPDRAASGASVTGNDIKKIVIWSLVGVVATGTVGYLGYKLFKKAVSNQANKGSLDPTTPAYFAKQFKVGFDNNNAIGIDMNLIRQTMLEIPSKEVFGKVVDSYHRQYSGSLYKDLEKYLKSTELEEVIAIYSIKPSRITNKNEQPIYDPYAWAKRIHAAVNYETGGFFWGTDEEAIKQVMRELPNQQAWEDLRQAYQAKYSLDIKEDIDGDLDPSDYDFRQELRKKGIAA